MFTHVPSLLVVVLGLLISGCASERLSMRSQSFLHNEIIENFSGLKTLSTLSASSLPIGPPTSSPTSLPTHIPSSIPSCIPTMIPTLSYMCVGDDCFTTINGNTSITNTGGPIRRLLYAEAAVINNNVMSLNDQVFATSKLIFEKTMKYVLGIDVNVSITNIISKGGGSVDIYWSIIIFVEDIKSSNSSVKTNKDAFDFIKLIVALRFQDSSTILNILQSSNSSFFANVSITLSVTSIDPLIKFTNIPSSFPSGPILIFNSNGGSNPLSLDGQAGVIFASIFVTPNALNEALPRPRSGIASVSANVESSRSNVAKEAITTMNSVRLDEGVTTSVIDECQERASALSNVTSPKTRQLINGWVAIKDSVSGQYYFWHETTNKTTWTRPGRLEIGSNDIDEANSPKTHQPINGWVAIKDSVSGQYYFWHKDTSSTTWTRPDNFKDIILPQSFQQDVKQDSDGSRNA